MRVKVQPAADGFDMRGNWVTKKGGKTKPSTRKSAALRKARNLANEGDTLVVKGTDGQVLSGYPRTYRGANATSTDNSRRMSSDSRDDSMQGSRRRGVRDRDRDDGRERPTVADHTPDETIDDFDGVEFKDPVEGDRMLRDDFEENQDDAEGVLDDLF